MNSTLWELAQKNLIWLPEKGIGFYPASGGNYGGEYFEKYEGYAKTLMGKKITDARINLVMGYKHDTLIDIGVGCGDFLRAYGNGMTGYDINPVAIKMLNKEGLYFNIYKGMIGTATFWDSLEHIAEPFAILRNVRHLAFFSLPIFKNAKHLLGSKHYRKDEHYWYFTRDGFILFMGFAGFKVLEHNDMESRLGREDIETFVFKRVVL